MNTESENEKIYVIEEYEFDSDDGGNIIGYCKSMDAAEKICKKLEMESEKNNKQYNEYCSNCICNCEAFGSPTDNSVVESLNTVRNSKCPYAKDVEIKEIFYGSENESGGFEICCSHMRHDYCKCVYTARECNIINEGT